MAKRGQRLVDDFRAGAGERDAAGGGFGRVGGDAEAAGLVEDSR